MRPSLYVGLVMAVIAGSAAAKLPPLDEDGKLKAAEAAAKNAWNEKVGLLKHCQALDRIAASYRIKAPSAASAVPVATPACVDPGPYVSAAAAAASAASAAKVTTAVTAAAGGAPAAQGAAATKPLEVSGAHSPAAAATTPPSTRTPAAATVPITAAPNAAMANAGTATKPAPGAQPARTAATPITPVKDKPVEMSEAHSPPGTAVSPPSVNATNAELTGKAKK